MLVAPADGSRVSWDELASLTRRARLTVLATPPGRARHAAAALGARGLAPALVGRTRDDDSEAPTRETGVLLYEGPPRPLTPQGLDTPQDFTVVAFVTTYNEEDIIGATLADLIAEGVTPYVIDNWSTDHTWEVVSAFEEAGLAGRERHPPEGPPDYYDLHALLRRVESLSQTLPSDWFIKHDADEIRRSPWPGVTLRDALYRVQAAGYNCADFTVLNFPPTDDSFLPGSRPADRFRYFEFGTNRPYFRQLKAWQSLGHRIEYASTGGHEARFPGRRVFPYKFLNRHYPIRSQQHGERKVFRERQGRFLPEARARGWHRQYDEMRPGHQFRRDPESLLRFDEATFARDYLVERLSGVGLPRRPRGAR
ncbi:MAG: glycosyltransferase family 2 protein [Acidimicrobiia bacterium]|nr:glycosyltransferase family 2 protein [Acidimicrobiia bacterium]